MNDLNLLDFYRDAAHVLTRLYIHFPRKMDICVEDMIGTDQVDDFGLHSKRHEAAFGALLWLADEGYLRFNNTIRQEAIDQAILSQKGLLMLGKVNYPPTTNDTDETAVLTTAEYMQKALRSHSSTQLSFIMQHFFNESTGDS